MDTTVKLLYNYLRRRPVDAYECASELFELGYDGPVLHRMVFLGNGVCLEQQDLYELLRLIGRSELMGRAAVRREIEGHLNRDYLDGKLDGWSLIQQCCDLYWDTQDPDEDSSMFWCSVADDADQHGGECCIEFPFNSQDFNSVLQTAIIDHERPVAKSFDRETRST